MTAEDKAGSRWSVRAVRGVSIALAVLAVGAIGTGVVAFPPVLARWVLTAQRVQSDAAAALLWVLGAGLVIGGGLLGRSACRLWARSTTVDSRNVQFAFATLVLSGIVGAGLVEVAVRVLVPPQRLLSGTEWWMHRWTTAQETGVGSDGRISETIPEHPGLHVYDSRLGWTLACGYQSKDVATNSRGVRGLREHASAKPPGERRIVTIGDSFTFGYEVSDGQTYAEVLDGLMDDVRVINLGVSGYGTDQQYLRLQRSGFAYAPDLVILGFYSADADRNLLSFRDYAKPVYRLTGDELHLYNVPIPDPSRTDWSLRLRPPRCYLWAIAGKALKGFLDLTPRSSRWVVSRRLLDAIADDAQTRGARFMVVHIPLTASPEPEDAELVVRDWAADRQIPFLSSREVFSGLDDRERRDLYRKSHWGPLGHRLVAEAIQEKIVRESLLPPPLPAAVATATGGDTALDREASH